MKLNESIFKSYDIRGIYPNDLNEVVAEDIAQCYLKFVARKRNKQLKDLVIVVGRDIRVSSEPLTDKIIEVFLRYGVSVMDVGLCSINDIYFATGYYQYDGGIMATASHNPAAYGGLKMIVLNRENQSKVDIINGQDILQEIKRNQLPLTDQWFKGHSERIDIKEDIIKHIMSFVNLKNIKPFKIVIDIGGGMNGPVIKKIFEKLPIELIPLFFKYDPTFSCRPPNPLTAGASEIISHKVLETNADFGVMFDVDGDRMFLLDETGRFVKGDMTLLLLAKAVLEKNPGQGVAYNLICSHAVPEFITKWGGRPLRSEVGYINLARHMLEGDGIISGEVSGHYAFKENYFADSGYLALLFVLQTLSEDGRKLSKIIDEYSLYARGDEINLEVTNIEDKLSLIRDYFKDNILDEVDGITVEFANWWFNVRASNTEPLLRITVEAQDESKLKERQAEILEVIKEK